MTERSIGLQEPPYANWQISIPQDVARMVDRRRAMDRERRGYEHISRGEVLEYYIRFAIAKGA